jgi:hypothetical protein
MPNSEPTFGKLNRTPPKQAGNGSNHSTNQDSGTTLNAGFIATAVALFTAVGSGAFYFMNGGISLPQFSLGSTQDEPAYVSSVDKVCSKGWEKELPNVDQMHCYMTKSMSRLCDPKERAHLIATIGRFEDDYTVWSNRHFAAAMGTIINANQNAVEIGMETAKLTNVMNDPNASDEDREKQANKVGEIMGGVLEGSNKVLAENKSTIPHYQLQYDLTELASMGFIAEDDFGWSKPDWVKKGFAEVKKVRSACAK